MWRAITAILLIGGACQAEQDEKVTLKKHVGKLGERIQVTSTTETVTTSLLDVFGDIKKRVEKSSRSEVYVTEILEEGKAGALPMKLARTFEKAEETFGGKTVKAAIAGKTVLITRNGDKYTFALADGGAVPREIVSLLDGEFNRTPPIDDFTMFFPAMAITSGESWDIKAGFLSAFEKPFLFHRTKTTGSAKLVRTLVKEGKTFGVIEARVEAPLAGIQGLPADAIGPGSRMNGEWKGEGCIDGTAPSCKTVHTLIARTVMDKAESNMESTTTRTVELLPRK